MKIYKKNSPVKQITNATTANNLGRPSAIVQKQNLQKFQNKNHYFVSTM